MAVGQTKQEATTVTELSSHGPTPDHVSAAMSAAKRFVDFVMYEKSLSAATLAQHLDELAASYHVTPLGEPDESDDQPPTALKVEYSAVSHRFPGFGYYRVVDPDDLSAEALIGDAVDDVMDITNDLREVLWRNDRFGVDDANWYFRFLFEHHWGNHVRDLARYLHSRVRAEVEERFLALETEVLIPSPPPAR